MYDGAQTNRSDAGTITPLQHIYSVMVVVCSRASEINNGVADRKSCDCAMESGDETL